MKNNGMAGFSDRPSGFRSGESAADDMERRKIGHERLLRYEDGAGKGGDAVGNGDILQAGPEGA